VLSLPLMVESVIFGFRKEKNASASEVRRMLLPLISHVLLREAPRKSTTAKNWDVLAAITKESRSLKLKYDAELYIAVCGFSADQRSFDEKPKTNKAKELRDLGRSGRINVYGEYC